MSKQPIQIKQRGQIWHYSFTAPNGQRIRQSARTGEKRQAIELAAEHYNRLWREHKLGERPDRTWQEAVVEWLSEQPERSNNPNYMIHLRWLDPHLGHLKLSQINRDTIKAIQSAKQAEGVKPHTVNAVLQQTRVILRAALAWEWIDKIPAIKLLQEPDRRIRWLSPEEESCLLPELPTHMQRIVVFALSTGLRMSNILTLTWQQIDLARRQAWIYADQAKSRQSIGVPLNDDAMTVLAACLGDDPTHVFVFRKKPIKRVNGKAWRKALERAGIQNFHFHDLRHTWATRHLMNGTPLHVLQELGGWSDISMLRKYAHLSIEHLHLHANNSSGIGTNLTHTKKPTKKPASN